MGLNGGGGAARCVAQEAAEGTVQQAVDGTQREPSQGKSLFDGKSLEGWKITPFGGHGEVVVEDGMIVMGMGSALTGITYEGEVPRRDYEVLVEAMRVDGVDFFSTITFPVGQAYCSFVVGGWGGAVVGISSLDYADASQNETTKYMRFEPKRWYRIRVQVRGHHVAAWIDDQQVVNVDTEKRQLGTRIEVERSKPLGIASWETRAAIRKIELRVLDESTK